MASRFLSECEAALYLGMTPAQLAGLRKFDLAMIEKGHKPHGPPPLWQGRSCIYASESLDEWMGKRSRTVRTAGPAGTGAPRPGLSTAALCEPPVDAGYDQIAARQSDR